MNNTIRKLRPFLLAASIALPSYSFAADEHSDSCPMGHDMPMANCPMRHDMPMDHGQMKHDMPMDHGQMKHDMPMDHGQMKHDMPMDHSMMQMQGGSAPANARDPDAYSGGYSLRQGPYALPNGQGIHLMDSKRYVSFMADRLEFDPHKNAGVYDIYAAYGSTYDRLIVKSEGDVNKGRLEKSKNEVLWGHAITDYFDTQFGVRLDQFDQGQARNWLAFGVQGLAPYWFELNATAYLGEQGRAALNFSTEYDLLISQRAILQPRLEFNLYSSDDAVNGIGGGLSDASFGLRLRYEFNRQFAPYVGVVWNKLYGQSAAFALNTGESVASTQYVIGARFWF